MWKWMKILSYFQQQKCSPGTLVSGDIRLMEIFARVLAQGGVEWQWVVESGRLSMPLVDISSEPLKIRPNLAQTFTTEIFSMDSIVLRRCAFYADICRGSLKGRRQQTTVGAILVDSYACIRCHVGLIKIPHLTFNKTEKPKFPLVALWWDDSTKRTPCSLSGSWASCWKSFHWPNQW